MQPPKRLSVLHAQEMPSGDSAPICIINRLRNGLRSDKYKENYRSFVKSEIAHVLLSVLKY